MKSIASDLIDELYARIFWGSLNASFIYRRAVHWEDELKASAE